MRAQPVAPLAAGDEAEMEQLLARSATATAQASITAQDVSVSAAEVIL